MLSFAKARGSPKQGKQTHTFVFPSRLGALLDGGLSTPPGVKSPSGGPGSTVSISRFRPSFVAPRHSPQRPPPARIGGLEKTFLKMKFIIKAKPGCAKNAVEKIDSTHYIVRTTEPPKGGRANTAIISLLAEYLKLPKTALTIKRGLTARQKTVEV